jgi:hypothetical protein
LQKVLESGIPLETDNTEDSMDGVLGGESQGVEANPEDDSTAFDFLCSWIQRQMHRVREAFLQAVLDFRTSSEWCDRTQVTADSEARSHASVSKSTTELS